MMCLASAGLEIHAKIRSVKIYLQICTRIALNIIERKVFVLNEREQDSVLAVINQDRNMVHNSIDIETEVHRTVQALRKGHVILYPTDTIWGLGCDFTNESAVKRIYEIKNRDENQPFLLLVDSIEMLKRYVARIHPRIETLLVYHEQPLTLIYKSPIGIPNYLLSKTNTVAIRYVKHRFCQELITHFGKPIVSTSANRSGETFPKNYRDISKTILQQTDYIVQYAQDDLTENAPSVLASYNAKGELEFLRE